jgi:hypothetical protein
MKHSISNNLRHCQPGNRCPGQAYTLSQGQSTHYGSVPEHIGIPSNDYGTASEHD